MEPHVTETTEQGPRLLDPAHRLLLVGIVALITVVATEAMAIATVMPVVEEELRDLWLYGWVFSGFYLGTLVGVVIGGRAVDRMPPVGPMVAGIGIFTAGLLVGGLAPSMAVLVLGRVLQGIGAGAVPVVAYVCISRGFPAVLRPRAFAVMSSAWVLPSLVSPLLASEVADSVGWRWVFLGLIPVTVVVAALALPAVRSVPSGASGPADGGSPPERAPIATVTVLVLATGLVLGGLSLDQLWIGVVLAAVGVAVGIPPFRALTPSGTLQAAAGLPAAIMTRGVLTFTFFSVDAFVSLALTSVRGTSTRYAGVVLAAASLTWTTGSWLQARLADRWGPARLVRTGGLLLLAGTVALTLSLSSVVPLVMWIPAVMLNGLGMGLAYPQISVVTLAEAPRGGEGAATSALQMTDMLGMALGTGLAGVIVSVGARYQADAWVPLAVVFLLATCTASMVAGLGGRLRRSG